MLVSTAAFKTQFKTQYKLQPYLIKNQSNIQFTHAQSVASFLALALAFVSLTFNSLAL